MYKNTKCKKRMRTKVPKNTMHLSVQSASIVVVMTSPRIEFMSNKRNFTRIKKNRNFLSQG
jgi:hypothetical protein